MTNVSSKQKLYCKLSKSVEQFQGQTHHYSPVSRTIPWGSLPHCDGCLPPWHFLAEHTQTKERKTFTTQKEVHIIQTFPTLLYQDQHMTLHRHTTLGRVSEKTEAATLSGK